MTKNILNFPVRHTQRLSCVWIKTGDPARPLACRWIATDSAESESQSASVEDAQICRICA